MKLQGASRFKEVDSTSWAMQETREVLARLKRMAGFESQNFDPVVRPMHIAGATGLLQPLAFPSGNAIKTSRPS
jgi:hypothetical protein